MKPQLPSSAPRTSHIGVPDFNLDAPQPFDDFSKNPEPLPRFDDEASQLSDRKTGYYYTTTYNHGALASQDILFSETDIGGKHSSGTSNSSYPYMEDSMDVETVDYKKTSLGRTRRILHRLILHNYSDSMRMVTLTYAKGVHSRKQVWLDIQAMAIRWKDAFGDPLNYIAVLELHPGGHGYHVHMVVNIPWFDYKAFRTTIWRKGRIRVSKKRKGSIRDSASKLAGYLLKYIGKDFDSFVPGQRRYSRGGSWATDWRQSSGFTDSPFTLFHKVLDYMTAHKIAHRKTIIKAYGDCTIYKISWDSGAHPDLPVSALYQSQHEDCPPSTKDYGPFCVPEVHGANILDI